MEKRTSRSNPGLANLERAASLLREGKLVAFPTETVYGLGANALDPMAVESIYRVKGRPSTSPLIVHVSSVEMAKMLAEEWPESATRLAACFWPGPLTMVLRKNLVVPDVVTAGLDTVGLRMPAHPLALALIKEAGVPLAAPSANRFTELSPTSADHVRQSIGGEVDLVLDGGPCEVGIESAVVSLAGPQPVLLRPGIITLAQLEAVIGPVIYDPADAPEGAAHPSPGMHRRHYSPRTPLCLVDSGQLPKGEGAYLYWSQGVPGVRGIAMPADARGYAAALYEALHQLDAEHWAWIAIERPPSSPEWAAILDRLTRATAE